MLGAIGIGGSLAAPPLPHHRTYGSVYGGSVDYARGWALTEGLSMVGPTGTAGPSGAAVAARASVPSGAALGASPLTSAPKASSSWFFHRLVRTRSPSFLPTPPFGPSVIAPPTMPSADFCAAITGLATRSVRETGHGTDLPR